MQNLQQAQVTLPSDREIVITRTLDAPPSLVFEMWTTPEHVTQWWDPNGQPLSECEIDLRVGGTFRFVSAGAGHTFAGTYQQIDAPSRLVFTANPPGMDPSTGIVDLRAEGDVTRIVVTISCASKAQRDAMLAMHVHEGTKHTVDNLAAYLDTVQSGR